MSTDAKPTLVPTTEVDYLDEDKQIRGQNYVCLSFISPEDVLANKEVFYFNQFLGKFGTDMKNMFETLSQKYPDDAAIFKTVEENHAYIFAQSELEDQYKFFKRVHAADIESDFHQANEFRTSIRGIKVRGVFDTLKEAQVRAEVLKRMGDKFDIFIGQVGCWCPWSPNPEDLQEQEYPEAQLNTMMKKYKENMNLRDEMYEKRKHDKIQEALTAKDTWSQRKEDDAVSVAEEVAPIDVAPIDVAPIDVAPIDVEVAVADDVPMSTEETQ